MKKYLRAFTMVAAAGAIAIAGVNTQIFAGGTASHQAWEANDEAPPSWALCNISLDCLRT